MSSNGIVQSSTLTGFTNSETGNFSFNAGPNQFSRVGTAETLSNKTLATPLITNALGERWTFESSSSNRVARKYDLPLAPQLRGINVRWDAIVVHTNSTFAETLDAITDASVNKRYCVYVPDGTYSNVYIEAKPYVDIVGQSRTGTVLHSSSGTQDTIWNSGNTFILANMTVCHTHNTGDAGVAKYAVHMDAVTSDALNNGATTATFYNLNLHAYGTSMKPALGIGVWANQRITVIDCIMTSETGNATDCHNIASQSAPAELAYVNCGFDGGKYGLNYRNLGSGQADKLRVIDCYIKTRSAAYTSQVFSAAGDTDETTLMISNNIYRGVDSSGNDIPAGTYIGNTNKLVDLPFVRVTESQDIFTDAVGKLAPGASISNSMAGAYLNTLTGYQLLPYQNSVKSFTLVSETDPSIINLVGVTNALDKPYAGLLFTLPTGNFQAFKNAAAIMAIRTSHNNLTNNVNGGSVNIYTSGGGGGLNTNPAAIFNGEGALTLPRGHIKATNFMAGDGSLGLHSTNIGGIKIRSGIVTEYTNDAWHLLELTNNWVNFTNTDSYYPVAGYKKTGSIVRLKGLIASGDNNAVAAYLPAGYRPRYAAFFPLAYNNGYARAFVDPAGEVKILGVTNVNYLSIDSISFDTE